MPLNVIQAFRRIRATRCIGVEHYSTLHQLALALNVSRDNRLRRSPLHFDNIAISLGVETVSAGRHEHRNSLRYTTLACEICPAKNTKLSIPKLNGFVLVIPERRHF